jgi:hypothetical protein
MSPRFPVMPTIKIRKRANGTRRQADGETSITRRVIGYRPDVARLLHARCLQTLLKHAFEQRGFADVLPRRGFTKRDLRRLRHTTLDECIR